MEESLADVKEMVIHRLGAGEQDASKDEMQEWEVEWTEEVQKVLEMDAGWGWKGFWECVELNIKVCVPVWTMYNTDSLTSRILLLPTLLRSSRRPISTYSRPSLSTNCDANGTPFRSPETPCKWSNGLSDHSQRKGNYRCSTGCKRHR